MKNARPLKTEASAETKLKISILRDKIANTMLATYENWGCRGIRSTRDLAEECYLVADYVSFRWESFLDNDRFIDSAMTELSRVAKRYWAASFTTGMLAEECADTAAVMLLASGDLHGCL